MVSSEQGDREKVNLIQTQSPFSTISIVIPNYNLADYLEQTIESVVGQSYPHCESIVVDGSSDDGSIDIIERHRSRIDKVLIEPDTGHANALNKGFALSKGAIMGWINSDDVLLPGCLETVAQIFHQFPDVDWIVGNTSHLGEAGHLLRSYPSGPLSRLRFMLGDFRFVQQESVFWRRSLWRKAGAKVNENLKFAVDFEL